MSRTTFVNRRIDCKEALKSALHDNIEHWKEFGREVAVECLEVLTTRYV